MRALVSEFNRKFANRQPRVARAWRVLRRPFATLLFTGSIFCGSNTAAAGLDDIMAGLPGIADGGKISWGDYDKDGDLDLLISGVGAAGSNFLYRNDGGTFVQLANALPDLEFSSGEWVDLDGDGDLDIINSGRDTNSNDVTVIYRNNGSGSFTQVATNLPGASQGCRALGDFDNDGDIDVFLAGRAAVGDVKARLFRNDGSGVFTDVGLGATAPEAGVSGAANWGDYDADGDLDLVYTRGGLIAVFSNQNNQFETAGLSSNGLRDGTALFGDSDNDGDLDILLTGVNTSNNNLAFVLRSDGGTSFTFLNNSYIGGCTASAWGDYDNDGDNDILAAGSIATSNARVMLNNGSGFFSNVATGLTAITSLRPSVAWGDFDNDGKLDAAVSGTDAGGTSTRVYRNNTGASTTNAAPDAPSMPTVDDISGEGVKLSWTAPADDKTASAGLSYAIRIGTTPGADDALRVDALPSGQRTVAKRGPITGTSWRACGLKGKTTYYWSVQAIDSAFAGSAFSAEGSFTTSDFERVNSALPPSIESIVELGDFDNDGDLDLFYAGSLPGFVKFARIYRNDGNGNFTDINAGLPGTGSGKAAWGDYDNDGDLDLVYTGFDAMSNRFNRLCTNNGDGTFATTSLPGSPGSVSWGDYDHDGDLDLLIKSSGTATRILRNDDGTFTTVNPNTIITYGEAVFADVDGDGYVDIVMGGFDYTSRVTKVYGNNRDGTFTETISAPGLSGPRINVADIDNDGDLDILLQGSNATTQEVQLLRNDAGTLVNTNTVFPVCYAGAIEFGDFDNDGDADILVSGRRISYSNDQGTADFFINTNGTFAKSGGLLPILYCNTAFGDFDNDGDLDAVHAGAPVLNGYRYSSRVYRNVTANPNTRPAAPATLLASDLQGTSPTLAWSSATDAQTATAGLSYALRVGTTPGGCDIVAPEALIGGANDGRRLRPGRGPIQGTNFVLKDLTPGTKYYWSVQTVDTTFAGSVFAAEASFQMNAAPTDIALTSTSVAENVANNTAIGTLSTTDLNTGETFTYSFATGGADNGAFTLDNGILRTAAALNFETKDSYAIKIRSTDGGGKFFEKDFTINVTNVNETPTDIGTYGSDPIENSSNEFVTLLSTADPDVGNTFTYELVAGVPDNAAFVIDDDELRTAVALNFEAKSVYTIRVKSTDGGGLSIEKDLVINVDDVNEVPTNVGLVTSSVAELTPAGMTVGAFTTTDEDFGDTFTYTFAAGGVDNGAFEIVGGELRTLAPLDFETKNSYAIKVRTTDLNGLFVEKDLTIDVTNANEAPSAVSLNATSVAENSVTGTVVGTLSTVDIDAGDTFTYTLVAGGADNAAFAIAGSELRTAAAFDFETKTAYTIRIRSTDTGGLIVEKDFTIDVTAANDAPLIVSSSALPNPVKIGDTVNFSAAATDVDSTALTFAWTFGDGSSGTGAAPSHVYALPGIYTVSVTVSDGAGGTATGSITLTVTTIDGGTLADNDGDGILDADDPDDDNDLFSDELEASTGSNPLNGSTTPAGEAVTLQALTVAKLSIALNFSKPGNDSVSLSGTVPVPAGFAVLNKAVTVDVGGAIATFTLDKKGKSKTAQGTFAIGVKAKKGAVAAQTAKFSAKLAKGNFAEAFADEGLTSADAKAAPKTVRVNMVFAGGLFQKDQPQLYSSGKGKGKTK